MKMNIGDTVHIKPEWQDKGDDAIHFVIAEILGPTRFLISDKNSTMNIIPQHLVTIDMIED